MLKELIAGEKAAEGVVTHDIHLALELFLSVPKT